MSASKKVAVASEVVVHVGSWFHWKNHRKKTGRSNQDGSTPPNQRWTAGNRVICQHPFIPCLHHWESPPFKKAKGKYHLTVNPNEGQRMSWIIFALPQDTGDASLWRLEWRVWFQWFFLGSWKGWAVKMPVVSKTIHQSHGRSDASWCHIMPLLLLLLNQFGLAKIEGSCKMVRSCEHIGQEMNYTSSDGQKDIQ